MFIETICFSVSSKISLTELISIKVKVSEKDLVRSKMIKILQILIVAAHVFRAKSLCYDRYNHVFCVNEEPSNVRKHLENRTDQFEWKFSQLNSIDSETFGNENIRFTSMKQLHLIYNDILTMECNVFSPFPNLETLNLTANQISELKKCFFESVRNVKILDLSKNELQTFEIELHPLMPQLQQLDLSYNGLRSFNAYLLTALDALESLDLSGNELKSFDVAFPDLLALQIFRISNNFETIQITADFFRPIPNLRHFEYENSRFLFASAPHSLQRPFHFLMQFDFNGIVIKQFIEHLVVLDDDLLGSEFANSTNFDFSSLGIEKIQFSEDPTFNNLQSLNLSMNRIARLSSQIICEFYRADTIDLSSNRIASIESNVFKPLINLRQLFLANNFIENIELAAVWQHLDSLEVLDLTNNRISLIPAKFMLTMPSLRTINLQYNAIKHLSFQILHPEISLHSINVRGNPIDTISDPHLARSVDTIVIDKSTIKGAIRSFNELSIYLKLFNTTCLVVEDDDNDVAASKPTAGNANQKVPSITAANRNRILFRFVLIGLYLACVMLPAFVFGLRTSRRLNYQSQMNRIWINKTESLKHPLIDNKDPFETNKTPIVSTLSEQFKKLFQHYPDPIATSWDKQ